MRINDLLEKRKNPEQNPKESIYDFILKHSDNPNAYLHTSNVQKVGINPKSHGSHDSPIGIYCYKLSHIKKNVEDAKENNLSVGHFIPYIGGHEFFILETKQTYPDDTLANYSQSDLKKDIEILKQKFNIDDDEIDALFKAAQTNRNFVNHPIGYMWGITKSIVSDYNKNLDSFANYPDLKKWNSLMRTLGFEVINDPGYGLIHNAEKQQSLILSKEYFDIADHMTMNKKQSKITIGGTTYTGGRIPKNLEISRVDDTEIANLPERDDPAMKKVKTITITGTLKSIRDLMDLRNHFPRVEKIVVNRFIANERSLGAFDIIQRMKIDVKIDTLLVSTHALIDKDIQALEQFATISNRIVFDEPTMERITRRGTTNMDDYLEKFSNSFRKKVANNA